MSSIKYTYLANVFINYKLGLSIPKKISNYHQCTNFDSLIATISVKKKSPKTLFSIFTCNSAIIYSIYILLNVIFSILCTNLETQTKNIIFGL